MRESIRSGCGTLGSRPARGVSCARLPDVNDWGVHAGGPDVAERRRAGANCARWQVDRGAGGAKVKVKVSPQYTT